MTRLRDTEREIERWSANMTLFPAFISTAIACLTPRRHRDRLKLQERIGGARKGLYWRMAMGAAKATNCVPSWLYYFRTVYSKITYT